MSDAECEQVFFNEPLFMVPDARHSRQEDRYLAMGRSDADRPLMVVFTMRGNRIRVISARDMNRKERQEYLR